MKILYFAWLRAKVGVGEEDLSPPGDVATVGQLVEWLKSRSPGHAQAFAQPSLVRAAVNQEFSGLDQAVGAHDEIAFFPPVTGG